MNDDSNIRIEETPELQTKIDNISAIVSTAAMGELNDENVEQFLVDVFGDSKQKIEEIYFNKENKENKDIKGFRKEIFKKLLELDIDKVKNLHSKYVKEEKPWRNIAIAIFAPIIISVTISVNLGFFLVIVGWGYAFFAFLGHIFSSHKRIEFENKTRSTKDELTKFIKEDRSKKNKEVKEKENLVETTNSFIAELDKDNNGIIDVIESNDLRVLLNEHQEKIKSIDIAYLQKFVKVSSWLEAKKNNIQQIFESVKELNSKDVNIETDNILIDSLKSEVHVYEQILFNALNMVSALIDDDMLTFYEIENAFDDLNMFDSKLEKDISDKLSNIGDGLNAFVNEMNESTNRIIESVQTLTYVTAKTNERLEGHLKNINSSIKVGNLVNSINTYQNWRQKKLSDVKSQ